MHQLRYLQLFGKLLCSFVAKAPIGQVQLCFLALPNVFRCLNASVSPKNGFSCVRQSHAVDVLDRSVRLQNQTVMWLQGDSSNRANEEISRSKTKLTFSAPLK